MHTYLGVSIDFVKYTLKVFFFKSEFYSRYETLIFQISIKQQTCSWFLTNESNLCLLQHYSTISGIRVNHLTRLTLLHARYKKCENMFLSVMNRSRRTEICWNGSKFAKEMNGQLFVCLFVCLLTCLLVCLWKVINNFLLFGTSGTTENRNSCIGRSLQVTEIGGR